MAGSGYRDGRVLLGWDRGAVAERSHAERGNESFPLPDSRRIASPQPLAAHGRIRAPRVSERTRSLLFAKFAYFRLLPQPFFQTLPRQFSRSRPPHIPDLRQSDSF